MYHLHTFPMDKNTHKYRCCCNFQKAYLCRMNQSVCLRDCGALMLLINTDSQACNQCLLRQNNLRARAFNSASTFHCKNDCRWIQQHASRDNIRRGTSAKIISTLAWKSPCVQIANFSVSVSLETRNATQADITPYAYSDKLTHLDCQVSQNSVSESAFISRTSPGEIINMDTRCALEHDFLLLDVPV